MQALDTVSSLGSDELAAVLAEAEVQRPGARIAFAAALKHEAQQLAALSSRAFAAADRLAGQK
ncbi:acyl-coenzyme A thioesterase PaaI-like protein [Methylobacterium sp. BE186]|uniref:hypothetical protein n=1 Tax=Methylobacterium sp. BE186 TaxID=2817715 RepID=UPI00285C8B08|nr:hypothetical protein [Methylobacterium sp. BE186]MDR7039193.1 acyl-coenzyme A thioesterase PaaI-like protein [Methylobacterium sp. BE186]